jgi:chemotaxis protein MotA
MDLSTIIGIVVALAAVAMGLLAGDKVSIMSFIDVPSLIIVFGGAIGATVMSFYLKNSINVIKILPKAFKTRKIDYKEEIALIVALANVARKEGLLSLESELERIKDPFLKKGVMLTIDGADSEKILDILETEVEELRERHQAGIKYFATLGGYAPTMGIIGTVMGLIKALQNLSSPDEIGGAISLAFITTLYGIAGANLLFIPFGKKLELNSNSEIKLRYFYMKAIMAIQSGLNPRLIEEELMTYLPPILRNKDETPKKK